MWCGVVRCGVVWRGVVWCGVVWCGAVRCGVAWRGVAWCGVAWCGVAWCGVAWCGVVWCGVAWCGVVWCGTFRVKQPTNQQFPRLGQVNGDKLCVSANFISVRDTRLRLGVGVVRDVDHVIVIRPTLDFWIPSAFCCRSR